MKPGQSLPSSFDQRSGRILGQGGGRLPLVQALGQGAGRQQQTLLPLVYRRQVNTCYNALDYHIDHGRGDQAALIYDSPVTDTIKTYTYSELRDEVASFAGVLAGQGVEKVTGSSSTCP
jgi:hypothetical protein